MKTIDESAILRFIDNFALKGRQAATIESYRRDSLSFLEYMTAAGVAAGDVSPDTLRDFQAYLKNRGFRDNSVRRSVIGVRQFFRFLQDDFGWDRSPFDDSPIPERDDSFNPRITPEHIQKLLAAVAGESSALKAARDQVMLLLLGIEGLKAGELIGLEWVDFMPSNSSGILRVKGPRDRT
ncbi:MAG: site-specific integrase, partial [Proteobacteria bacterium]|nr:site-specific integrase [Pseudomonadota bacterium]